MSRFDRTPGGSRRRARTVAAVSVAVAASVAGVAGVAGVAVTIAAGAWRRSAPAADGKVAAPAAGEMPALPHRRAAATRPASVAAVSPGDRAAPGVPGDCDFGRQPAEPPDSAASEPGVDPAVADARRTVVDRLVASTDPWHRAVGDLLVSRGPGEAGALARDRLAAAARRTESAGVYGLALAACEGASASAFCASLAAERWAQLAPDLAWAWLRQADEARRRGDLSGIENALNRAIHANDWRGPGTGIAAAMLDEAPPGLPASTRFMLTADALAREYAVLGPVQPLTDLCPAGEAAPGRRQVCRQLAEQMLARSDNLLELRVAIRLGERSGLPEGRLSALRRESDALLTAGPMVDLLGQPGEQVADPCAGLSRATVAFERQARLGELVTLRERAAQAAHGAQAAQAARAAQAAQAASATR